MSHKEKAKLLLNEMSKQDYSYQPYAGANYETEEVGYEAGKKCALIAVDELLSYIEKINKIHKGSILNNADWLKVRDELKLL